MSFLDDWLWELGEKRRSKREDKWNKKECSEGRHVLRTYDGEIPEFVGPYRMCKRNWCNYGIDNPAYDKAKEARWIRKGRAEHKAKQAAAALICAVKGCDLKGMPSPDWMMYCARGCGK